MADEPEKVDLETPDLAEQKRAAFEDLFPGVLADGVLDATRLGELLDSEVTAPADGRERYGLMWAGKQEAVRSLLAPSRGSLTPDLENSVNFDTAENVFIEGDNLEVLKLMQKAYNDEVKLIYIDPPYNTGNDFVYNDDFADGLRGYLEYTGQLDEDGNRTSSTSDSAGRRHSNWLSMMYPRLMLARNLLSQDGAILVSIDDNELSNLKSLLDEVFGQDNFLGCITVVSNLKGRSDDRYFATAHNYLLAYQRANFAPRGVPLPQAYRDDYPEEDSAGNRYRLQGLRKRGNSSRREDRPSMHYPIFVDPETTEVSLERGHGFETEVLPRLSDGSDGRWRWGRETAESRLSELMARQVGAARRWDVFQIDMLERDGAERRAIPKTVWDGSEVANEAGTLEVKQLLGKGIFDTPKPTGLIRHILEHCVGPDDLVLDFFAGSGTTAHAVALMNSEDGGSRRVVSINLPEPTSEGSGAREAGYRSVSDITLARLKAVMESVDGAAEPGLRVLRLDRSNFRETVRNQGELDLGGLTLAEEKPAWGAIAAEVLLKEGAALDLSWDRHQLPAGEVVVSDGIAVVLTLELDDEVVKQALDLNPRVVVFLEDGFAGKDPVKGNAVSSAKALGITMKTV